MQSMENEIIVRLSIFLLLFATLAFMEATFPKRKRVQSQTSRWFTNWALVIIDTLCLRVVAIAIPFVASLAAYDAQLQGWGVLNFLILPSWLEIIIAILVLDFAIWLQHLILSLIHI